MEFDSRRCPRTRILPWFLAFSLPLLGASACGSGPSTRGPPPAPGQVVTGFSESLPDRPGYDLYVRNNTDSPVTITEVTFRLCENVRNHCRYRHRPFVLEPWQHRRVTTIVQDDTSRPYRYRWNFRFEPGRLTTAAPRAASSSEPSVLEESDDALVLLDPRGTFVNVVIPLDEGRDDPWASWEAEFPRRVTRILYRSFVDAFDLVLIAMADEARLTGLGGRAFRSKVEVAGLGLSQHDRTAEFGSDGRLTAGLVMARHGMLDSPTSLHEIAHMWGQYVLPTRDGAHWGFAGVGGLLGGWEPGTLEAAGGGTWLARGPGGAPSFTLFGPVREGVRRRIRPYAPLELYLMGLLPADSVPPIQVADSAEWVVPSAGVFRASSVRTLTIQDIIEQHGPREPAYPDAPTSFRGIYVVVSAEPLDAAARELIHRDVQDFARPGPRERRTYLNFWEATGGRGSIVLDRLFDALRAPPPSASPGT